MNQEKDNQKVDDLVKFVTEYFGENGKLESRCYSSTGTAGYSMRVPATLEVKMDMSCTENLEKILETVERIRSASPLVRVHFVLDTINQKQ